MRASPGSLTTRLLSTGPQWNLARRITCECSSSAGETDREGITPFQALCTSLASRVGTGNIEFAALFAPKPQAMTAANDWTKELMTRGYPDLQKLYKTLGHGDRVHAQAFLHFDHNYNAVSRTAVYHFINKHLNLGHAEPIIERDYKPLTKEELSVWTAEHPKPSGDKAGDAHERALVKWMTDDAAKQVDALTPRPNDG